MDISNNSGVEFVKTNNITSLEDYSVSVKVIFAIVSVIFVGFSVIAIYALNKTRHTPKTARFLSSGLITYDILAVTFYSVRKFIENNEANILTQITGACFNYLAYITVGVMSLERLIIFYSPHFYIKHLTAGKVRLYVWLIWLTLVVAYIYVRFGACYFAHRNMTLYDVVGKCNTVSFLFYGVFIFATVTVSIACYIKIFIIVRSDKNTNSNKPGSISVMAKLFQNYKSTSLVFVYLVIIIITSTAYIIILCLDLDTVPFRLSLDVVNMMNCMMDPCMYVLWYSECRMEILKIISICIPSLRSRIENMRIKIYYIVTSERSALFRSNRVYPSTINESVI